MNRLGAASRALALALTIPLGWVGCTSTSSIDDPRTASPSAPGATSASSGEPGFRVFELLGEAVIPSSIEIDGAPVGGLSGITYDDEVDRYYAISDDPASRGPARFFTLAIDLSGARLEANGVEVEAMTRLLDRNGSEFGELSLDGEGIFLTPEGTLYISSEGQVDRGVDPFLREAALDGRYLRSFDLPEKFLPRPKRDRGIRHNNGFEGLTASPDGRWLFTSTENALRQDGPETDVGVSSLARLLRYERGTGRLAAEYVYRVDPVTAAPPNADGFRTRGLVELLALGGDRLLALERSYTQGVGNAIDLYMVSLAGATDVRKSRSLEHGRFRPVEKTLLIELAALGLELDNVEGMTFGPPLADGRQTLVLVSDDNFNPRQRNQVLALAIGHEAIEVAAIQGASHRSPLEGAWVRGVRGVVTARAARGPGFWMQGAKDADPRTSDAIFVSPAAESEVEPGARIEVDALVTEPAFGSALSVTTLAGAAVRTAGSAPLPDPVTLATGVGAGDRLMPVAKVDDDGLERFEPDHDTIDFLESLEGMRVALPPSVVIGPTTRFGEIAVMLEDGGSSDRLRSPVGGLVATGQDVNPERLLIAVRNRSDAPAAAVGDRVRKQVVGVVDYAFGAFRVLTESAPEIEPSGRAPERTALRSSEEALLVASYNVENLSARSGEQKFARVARSIVDNLSSPDILALQEIQDDNGPEDDGTVSASKTLELLTRAIEGSGGPAYEFVQIDPENLADGGQPGANIRVAYLFRPERVALIARGAPGPVTEIEILVDEQGPFLSPNPGRVDPDHPAFTADPERNRSGVRKALAAEFEFRGRRIFLVNVHLRSKRGDSPTFGALQPPVRSSEPLRSAEARVVGDFVDQLLDLDAKASVIVLGDFNEHPYRAPIKLLVEKGLENLLERVAPEDRYTYIFRGNSQVLDNLLVSPTLAGEPSVVIDVVHLNADFPASSRASDHDPILLGFSVPLAQDDS